MDEKQTAVGAASAAVAACMAVLHPMKTESVCPALLRGVAHRGIGPGHASRVSHASSTAVAVVGSSSKVLAQAASSWPLNTVCVHACAQQQALLAAYGHASDLVVWRLAE
jgi:hypothetical protein